MPDTDTPAIKPLITSEMVLPLLQEHFERPILNLQLAEGGNVAQTFSFTVGPRSDPDAENSGSHNTEGNQEYIVSFNPTMLVNFEKQAYVEENFASPIIPVPRQVHRGRLGEVYFAITEKAPGQNLLQIPRSEYLGLIPTQIELLDAIHQVSLGERPGYGYGVFDGNGIALWPSWRAHLESVKEEGPAGDFFENWHALFQTSFLEREVFERLFSEMMQLISYCPEERFLVHGNYGFGNLLAQGGRITAVLDWMNARYGDFLYDIAWLDFWSPKDGWHERFQQYYRSMGREVPFYGERVLCYQSYIALDALKFYAKAGNKAAYEWARDHIFALLKEPRL
jgi:hygromycin-B 4-O-kinase